MYKYVLPLDFPLFIFQVGDMRLAPRNPFQDELRLAELEHRLVVSAQLRSSGIEAGRRLRIIEEVSEWLDSCKIRMVSDS